MRIMGLDVGDKTIGIALSDPLGWTAQPLKVLRRTSLQQDLAELARLCQEQEVGKIVVGLPRNMNGTYGPRAQLVMEFKEKLEKVLGLPVETWDERLSTLAAERTLLAADVSRARRKQVVDKLAAVVILQGYLDRQRN
ncbi:MAG: Holliday junction resolvase RuvX [Bacillota bacterium]